MPKNNAKIEERISQAIFELRRRKNVSRNKIAEEFCSSVQRLRSQLNGNLTTRSVQRLDLKKLAPDQKKGWQNYIIELDKTSIPAPLNMMERTANLLLQISVVPTKPPP